MRKKAHSYLSQRATSHIGNLHIAASSWGELLTLC